MPTVTGKQVAPDAARDELMAAIEAAMAREDRDATLGLVIELTQRHPEFQDGHLLFSQIMVELGRNTLALDSARKAVALDKSNARAMMNLSRVYFFAGFLEQAIQAAVSATNLIGEDAEGITALGGLFYRYNDFEQSIAMHERAIALDPGNTTFWYNLAISVQAAGDLDKAEKLFLKVIELDPDNAKAYTNLSRIRKQTPDRNHIAQIERLLTQGKPDRETAMHLSYALAKEYEDIEDFPMSFAFLKAGADIKRQDLGYSIERELRFVDDLIACFPPGCFDDYRFGHLSQEPIFIVGMPRSGTTLTEQILASHSDVFAAGELRDFGMNLILQSGSKKPLEDLGQDGLKRLLGTSGAQVGERYIEKTRPRTGHTRHFIDKLPRNSHLCGLIHWALPQAKMVLLDRHPVDVCFSNYKVLFKNGYEYSYSLEEIADYYIAYRRLMDHWKTVIPAESFYEISYEKLVANQEEESRKLVEFCGLEWQDACLQFYKNKEGVTTASLAQVRQPIYKSAVARWRNYREELQPLIARLEAAGIDCS